MRRPPLRSQTILLSMLAVLLLATACGRQSAAVRIAGSTSVQPLAEVLAEAYAARGGGRVTIQGGGSTAGIQALQNGVADLGAVSRSLTADESGKGLRAHIIGYDVLVVAVHPTNPLQNLSREQLACVFSGEVRDWAELGGPSGRIHLFSREAGSGSREAFTALVGPVGRHALIQNNSGALRLAVMNDPQAIGYINLGSALLGGVKPLRIDGRAPEEAGYPLRRPLSLVSLGEPSGDVAAFLRFALSPEGQRLVREEGLVPVHE